MTHQEALDILNQQIAEVHAGRRGFISRTGFRRKTGYELSAVYFTQVARENGLAAEIHGRYGWCMFLPRPTPGLRSYVLCDER